VNAPREALCCVAMGQVPLVGMAHSAVVYLLFIIRPYESSRRERRVQTCGAQSCLGRREQMDQALEVACIGPEVCVADLLCQ